MTSELIVDVSPKQISMAVLEDGRLVELQRERRDLAFAVGDIYLGKVKKVMPGLNAAFVDVGYQKDAFLHYLDLGLHFLQQQKLLELIDKQGSIPPPIQTKRITTTPQRWEDRGLPQSWATCSRPGRQRTYLYQRTSPLGRIVFGRA